MPDGARVPRRCRPTVVDTTHAGARLMPVDWKGRKSCSLIPWIRHPNCSKNHPVATIPLNSEKVMLGWAFTFFIVALVAAVFGFGGIAGDAAWIGQILLFVFLVLAVVSLVSGRRTRSIT
jgi:uncharacterized membrane protein YtjA (UPF0391 family)